MELGSQLIPRKTDQPAEEVFRQPLIRVIIHNDDITPMDFVTHILINIFCVPGENALSIMYTAHLNGSAYVQTLPKPEARRRINKAHFAARLKGYPLRFTMELE